MWGGGLIKVVRQWRIDRHQSGGLIDRLTSRNSVINCIWQLLSLCLFVESRVV